MQRLVKQRIRELEIQRVRVSGSQSLSSSPPLPLAPSPLPHSRRGSVLLVVIGLLLVLLLLGMTFFTFATQEDISAQYFTESAKVYSPNIDVDALWDWALRQLIVGPTQNEQNSALWAPQYDSPTATQPNFKYPHRFSLLANLVGPDYSPYSGQGVNLVAVDTNNDGITDRPFVDQNYDGRPDGNPLGLATNHPLYDNTGDQKLLDFNYSSAAQGVATNSGTFALAPFNASPDVDYTYPDINNLFLAYRGFGQDANANPVRVIIPSFFRPQLLRNATGTITDWWQNAATVRRMFRPHMNHKIANLPTYSRFLANGKDGAPGIAGVDDNTNGSVDEAAEQGWPGSDDFPFRVDRNLNNTAGELGVFHNTYKSGVGGIRPGQFSDALLLDYDKDNDGDGIPDGVLVDLGFPASQLPDGRWYIPLFSFTVYDADALVNANIAGNIMGLKSASGGTDPQVNNGAAPTQKFGYDPVSGGIMHISRSNQGIAPSEINLGMVLDTDPTLAADIPAAQLNAVLEQHRRYYGQNPATRVELANMELFSLLTGRPNYDSSGTITEYLTGRWGEKSQLQNGVTSRALATYPVPGKRLVDDDSDQNEGETTEYAGAISYRHPIDFSGAGTFLDRINSAPLGDQYGRKPFLQYSTQNLWLGYAGYHTTGTVNYFTAASGLANLMLKRDFSGQMSPSSWLLDHPMETIVDGQLKLTDGNDDVFGPEEMEGLHRDPNDPDYSLIVSRLQQLLPVNLQQSNRAAQIRERLTPESWDRLEYGLPHSSTLRTWEFNANINNSGTGASQMEFPPVSVSSTGQVMSHEPIRPELRKLLEIEQGNATSLKNQRRWDIHKFLSSTKNDQVGAGGWPTTATNVKTDYTNLVVNYRNLTPHPTSVNLGNAPVPATPTVNATSASTASDLEFWARRDRQQMARDIYVMLYLFGGGMDYEVDLNNNGTLDPSEDIDGSGTWTDVNYATTPNTPISMGQPRRLYTDAQLKQMAQFAVNFVDAIDRDNVITKFEYDRNLADGWNLDDNPFGTSGDTVASGDLGVVYGVEAQQLAFSEGLIVRSQQVMNAGVPADHPATEFNDKQERLYGYLELHNVSPFNVSVDADNPTVGSRGHWQVAAMQPGAPNTQVRELELRAGNITPGQIFSIGSRTYVDSEPTDKDASGNPLSSQFNVDPNWVAGAPNLQRIAPITASLGLDMVQNTYDANYRLSNSSTLQSDGFGAVWGSGTTIDPASPADRGRFLDATIVLPASTAMTFVLRRRLNPARQMPDPNQPPITYIQQEQDNPWIEVDRITIDIRNFNLATNNAPAATIQAQLTNLVSKERFQPLDGRNIQDHNPAAAPAWQGHSVGGTINQATQTGLSGQFTLWQPHFDRDFASIGEIFSVPLYDPANVVQYLPTGSVGATKLANFDGSGNAVTAQGVFMRPQHPSNALVVAPAVPDPKLDNRWYRLLEMLEVTHRAHRNLTLGSPRVPGKINLNTLRHTSVLGALLDDPFLLNYSTLASLDTSDTNTGGTRNWYTQFLRSRDQYDGMSQIYLPGMPNSRPFRSLHYTTASGPASDLERTLLRSLPSDTLDTPANANSLGDARRLFEVGTFNNHATITDQNYTDSYTRHRLLSKIHGNTTTRSHVFYVWVSVDFHEAIEVIPAVVDPVTQEKAFQIGGKLSGINGHRMFAVIDRSQADQLLNPNVAAQPFKLTNWKAMQVFRRTIE